MQASLKMAFKEWAVVVDALGHGEQILILRKGGIRENRGEFHVDHRMFWLFPTLFHEAGQAIIPSKRSVLHKITTRMTEGSVDIEFLAVADPVIRIADHRLLKRLQGKHIWTERVLEERFEFGREQGLHALIVRIYQLPAPRRFDQRESYAGCRSWVELEQTITGEVTPVLTDAAFAEQRDEICELLSSHAFADS